MYCNNCGNQINSESQFCNNCGAAIQNVNNVQPQTINQVSNNQQPIDNNPVNPAHQEFGNQNLMQNNQPNFNQNNNIFNFKKYLPLIVGGIAVLILVLFIANNFGGKDKIIYSDLTNDPANIKTVIAYNNTCKSSNFSFDNELYCYAQFEEYKEYVTLLNDICKIFCTDNLKLDKEGTIKSEVKRLYNLDLKNKDDNNYFVAMMYIFDDYKMAHDMYGNAKSYTNQYEVKAKIKENTKSLQETWNRFLAHKALDVEIDIRGNDPFVFDGKYKGKALGVREYQPIYDVITDENGKEHKEVVEPAPKDIPEEELTDIYAWARNYKATSPGSDGTYKKVIKDFADKFGVTLDYNFNNVYDGCYGSPTDDVSGVFAAYCHATPNKIFINNRYAGIGDVSTVNSITDARFKEAFNFPNIDTVFNMKDVRNLFTVYPYDLNSSIFLDVIKHEMAHHLIGKKCDTAQPLIARSSGVEVEAITNSYAMIYLGASSLDKFSPQQYWVTAQSDQIARGIHENGKCK